MQQKSASGPARCLTSPAAQARDAAVPTGRGSTRILRSSIIGIAASTTQSYDDLPTQAANYDIVGQPLFSRIGSAQNALALLQRNDPSAAAQVTAIGEATPLPLGVLQPTAARAMWRYYPASALQGSRQWLLPSAKHTTQSPPLWPAGVNARRPPRPCASMRRPAVTSTHLATPPAPPIRGWLRRVGIWPIV